MEKVVVVVVVTIREGSLGSGIRLDWENFRDPRLLIASSDKNEWSTLVNLMRCGASGKLTTRVANRSWKSFSGIRSMSSQSRGNAYPGKWAVIGRHAQQARRCLMHLVVAAWNEGDRDGSWCISGSVRVCLGGRVRLEQRLTLVGSRVLGVGFRMRRGRDGRVAAGGSSGVVNFSIARLGVRRSR